MHLLDRLVYWCHLIISSPMSVSTIDKPSEHLQNERSSMENIKSTSSSATSNILQHSWSPEQVYVAEKSKGSIVLRWDSKIDFYDKAWRVIGLWGGVHISTSDEYFGSEDMGKLSLVYGNHSDKNFNSPHLPTSFVAWMRIKDECVKHKVSVFESASPQASKEFYLKCEAEIKGAELLSSLWDTKKEIAKALCTLFWTNTGGYWNPENNMRHGIWVYSSLNISDFYPWKWVYNILWTEDDVELNWATHMHARQLLTFEKLRFNNDRTTQK